MSFHFQSFFISIITIYIFSFLLYSSVSFAQLDNIGPFQSISEGTSLVSKQRTFELGLFRPGNSTNRYLGIWFSKIPVQRVVWVANRCKPIIGSSGSLTVNGSGDLVLSYDNNKTVVVWSQTPSKQAQNPTLELLDSGNLVLRDENGDYLWQSFDYPSDTLLSGMKFGWDLKRGLNRNLSAWRNWDDSCHGGLVYGYEIADNRYPEAYMKRGNETVYRAGPWNRVGFSGSPEIRPNQLFNYSFVYDGNELYASYNLKNDSIVSIMVLNQTEGLQRLTWVEQEESFRSYARAPREVCDQYGLCGANGNCVISENPVCQCLKGFRPNNEEKWGLRDWSDGCVRNRPLNCKARDEFFKVVELKMPDTRNTWLNDNTSLSECRELCLKNCSCTAYANLDIRGKGSGCRIWLSDLVDIRVISESGQDLYIRVSESEIANEKASKRRVREAIIVVAIGAVIIGGFVFSYCFFWKRMRGKKTIVQENSRATDEEDLELPLFKLETLITATNNFSMSNKIGEGGFGPVYKGKLEDGQEIAVKRLSSSSRQGMNEFMNEVTIISKLQHRNLVKVLGCCIHGEEKLLVYEYMPNKSLDLFIFGQGLTKLLEWSTRFRVICGIARGLTYLHQDSRLRIIHRDLKASNVLLDIEMNPKISDFGLARAFGGDQTEVNTNRIVGSFGYMAPEYAYSGLFSTKSDVFSFGTLVLETVSGKRSLRLNDGLTLIGHAWTLLNEGRATELIDTRLTDSNTDLQEVLRCIHIGLLCVQQRPTDRPNMSSVVLMLSSDESVLLQPKPPGYFMGIETQQGYHSPTSTPEFSTTNSMTMSLINGR